MTELKFKVHGVTNDGDYLLSATEVYSTINDMMQDKQKEIDGLKQRAEKAERERDWLLERTGVNSGGVYFPCGYTKLDKAESLRQLRSQLKEGK